MIDILFINPGNAVNIYQDLAEKYSSIEPPTWALLLAESCRSIGISVAILDANAEKISIEQALERVKSINPRIICFVVYGQNVNAGAVGMSGAVLLSTAIKDYGFLSPIVYVGSYVQALPRKALQDEPSIDIVLMNEGVYAIRNLALNGFDTLEKLSKIKGIGWRKNNEVVLNAPEIVVPTELMDKDLPGYAWDLLPYKNKPFDLYRSPLWHSQYDQAKRSPYAAIQTSLGCQFKCSFCIINSINRNDNEEIGVASNYSKIRYWSPSFIIKEFEKLWNYGVRTIKITDELFLFNKKHYVPLCEEIIKRGYGKEFLLWTYSRVDTVSNPENLKILSEAGIKWLALGIESGNKQIRLEVSKGQFKDVDIGKIISQIHACGIEVMANYIFGLPGDTHQTMRETLDLSKKLCTSGWNAYPAINLPGSKLYFDAVQSGRRVPTKYTEYSFHSYNTVCNSTEDLSSDDILKFRDDAFAEYHGDEDFLNRIKSLYGEKQVNNIKEMNQIKILRKQYKI